MDVIDANSLTLDRCNDLSRRGWRFATRTPSGALADLEPWEYVSMREALDENPWKWSGYTLILAAPAAELNF